MHSTHLKVVLLPDIQDAEDLGDEGQGAALGGARVAPTSDRTAPDLVDRGKRTRVTDGHLGRDGAAAHEGEAGPGGGVSGGAGRAGGFLRAVRFVKIYVALPLGEFVDLLLQALKVIFEPLCF